jgi:glycosyltransferase involved in cell wall biosynthesis
LCSDRDPRLSACLIVRDEQAGIEACLESVRPFVDEVVVCDTGSRDGTAERASAAGAVVVSAPWRRDFAAARNVALETCSGQWVLSVDADETVLGVPGWLCVLLTAVGEDLDALSVLIDNGSAPDVNPISTHREPKLFRRGHVQWVGRVHERLVRTDGAPLRTADLPVETLQFIHHGYDDLAVARAKAARNADLAERELAERQLSGAAPEAVAQAALDLGRSHLGAGRPDRAIVPLRLARACGSVETRRWAAHFLAD